MDFYSLLKFLHCTCTPFNNLKTFKIWMSASNESSREILTNALKPLLLRRTKEELKIRGELNDLGDKKSELVRFKLSENEMKVYSKISRMFKTVFSQFMAQKSTPLKDRSNVSKTLRLDTSEEKVEMKDIFTLIIRLRQICNHPGLVRKVSSIMHSISLPFPKYKSYVVKPLNYITFLIHFLPVAREFSWRQW